MTEDFKGGEDHHVTSTFDELAVEYLMSRCCGQGCSRCMRVAALGGPTTYAELGHHPLDITWTPCGPECCPGGVCRE